EDALDLNEGAIHRRRFGLAVENLNGNILAVLTCLDVLTGELDAREEALLDGGNAKYISNAECCRLSGSEIPPSRPAALAIKIFAMHLEILPEVLDQHPAAIVANVDRLCLRVDRHHDG